MHNNAVHTDKQEQGSFVALLLLAGYGERCTKGGIMGWIADLLKEIPSAARYKSELEEMEKENAQLKAKISVLELSNTDLRQEIQRRDDIFQKEKSHGVHLEEIREKIVVLLASAKDMTESSITSSMGVNPQIAKFHLKELETAGLVTHVSITGNRNPPWVITQQGRAYLVSHGLLK